jgi:hypothetical protein
MSVYFVQDDFGRVTSAGLSSGRGIHPGQGAPALGGGPWAGSVSPWPALPLFTRVASMTAEQMRRPVVRPLWGSKHSRGAGLVARTYAAWKDCRISLSRAAQLLNCDRSTVRWRFADLDPDFAAWRERKRAASRGRAAARGTGATA